MKKITKGTESKTESEDSPEKEFREAVILTHILYVRMDKGHRVREQDRHLSTEILRSNDVYSDTLSEWKPWCSCQRTRVGTTYAHSNAEW